MRAALTQLCHILLSQSFFLHSFLALARQGFEDCLFFSVMWCILSWRVMTTSKCVYIHSKTQMRSAPLHLGYHMDDLVKLSIFLTWELQP